MTNAGSLETLFNTPLESGLRTLIVLYGLSPASCDLHRLKIFDYLLTHSDDVKGGPPSLHPSTPLRSGELLVRQQLIQDGLDLLISKGLVEKLYDNQGIRFRATDLTKPFLGYFETPYAKKAMDSAEWLAASFGQMSDEALQLFVNDNIGKWGAEFTDESFAEEEVE